MRITKENTTGLIIDIQQKLFPVMFDKDKLLNNSRILISGLIELKIPLLATQQYTRGLGETITELKSIIPEFSYIEKTSFSCFDEPVFLDKLKAIIAKNVIICGIESHVCVLQTSIDLKDAGYNPIVVMDCVSSRSADNYEMAKARFQFEGIMITSYESILFELTRTALATEFKAISKLVK